MSKISNIKRLALAAIITLVVGIAAFTVPLGDILYPYTPKIFMWNSSNSVPRGLYLKWPPENIKTGDYVAFIPSNNILEFLEEREMDIPDGMMFLKIVGAMSGETYRIDENNLMFYANGKYIGQVIEFDRKGNPMPKIRGEFVVEDGKFLPVGTSIRSFDGRYFGTQPLSSIQYRMVKVFSY